MRHMCQTSKHETCVDVLSTKRSRIPVRSAKRLIQQQFAGPSDPLCARVPQVEEWRAGANQTHHWWATRHFGSQKTYLDIGVPKAESGPLAAGGDLDSGKQIAYMIQRVRCHLN